MAYTLSVPDIAVVGFINMVAGLSFESRLNRDPEKMGEAISRIIILYCQGNQEKFDAIVEQAEIVGNKVFGSM